MNMNKKILFIITITFSFIIFSNNVYAACSDMGELGYGLGVETAETEEEQKKFDECRSQIENGFKCKVEFSLNGMATGSYTCKKSDQCAEEYYAHAGKCLKKGGNTEVEKKCSDFTIKDDCKTKRDCEWINGVCTDIYVAENPCSESDILKVFRFYGYLLMIAKVAIPLIIIVMGTFDLFKSVVDKDEKSLTKQVKILLMRVVAGVFIFFLPTFIYAIFDISTDLNIVNDTKYKACVDCLLKPNDCNTDVNNNGKSKKTESSEKAEETKSSEKSEVTTEFKCEYALSEPQCKAYNSKYGCLWNNSKKTCQTEDNYNKSLCTTYLIEATCKSHSECEWNDFTCSAKK